MTAWRTSHKANNFLVQSYAPFARIVLQNLIIFQKRHWREKASKKKKAILLIY